MKKQLKIAEEIARMNFRDIMSAINNRREELYANQLNDGGKE